jgi:hypothetical protein
MRRMTGYDAEHKNNVLLIGKASVSVDQRYFTQPAGQIEQAAAV